MIATLFLSQNLRGQIAREALAAHPLECCGLIEGTYIEGTYKEAAAPSFTLPLREGRKIRPDFSGMGQLPDRVDPSPKNSSLRSEFCRPSLKGRVCDAGEITSTEGTAVEAVGLACHPTTNLAASPDRFEIDPASHIALLRQLRGTGREIIGCYHSHPSGRAEPSATDLAGAVGENFLWLIAAGPELKAFVHSGHAFHPVHLA